MVELTRVSGKTRDRDLVLVAVGHVKLTLRQETGAPLAAGAVTCKPATARTDNKGEIAFEGVPAGTLTVSVVKGETREATLVVP